MKALFAAAPTFSLAATILATATVATMLLCRALSNRIPGAIIAMLGATVATYLLKLPLETIGTRFGGIPSGLPHFAIPHWHAKPGSRPARTRLHGGHARSHRVADVGRSFGPHEQRPPQSQRRADRTGSCQYLLADVRRLAGHRRHRPHRHQHPLRRAVTGGGHDPRADVVVHPAVCRAPGQLHSHGGAGGNPDDRLLQHGGVARNSSTAAADQDRHQRLAASRLR